MTESNLVPVNGVTNIVRVPYRNATTDIERRAMDPNLLQTEPAIAIIDEWIDELFVRVREGDIPKWREQCMKAYDAAEYEKLGKLLKVGHDRDVARKFLIDMLEKRSTRAERAKEISMRQDNVVTKGELNNAFGDIFDVLASKIDDKVLLHEIIKVITERISKSGTGLSG